MNKENLIKAAKVSLSSKVVSNFKEKLAEISVDAVMKVVDKERKDVNFDLIKIVGKPGRSIGHTELIDGILLDKDFSHP